MATITVDANNIYITDGNLQSNSNTITTTGNQICVQIIPTTKIDYVLDNNLQQVPIPIPKGDRGDEVPFQRIIDIKRIKENVTATGYLADEASGASGTWSSARKKMNDLITLSKDRGELTVVWGKYYATNNEQISWRPDSSNDLYGAFILKVQFTESVGKIGTIVSAAAGEEPAERNIQAIVTLVRGKDM